MTKRCYFIIERSKMARPFVLFNYWGEYQGAYKTREAAERAAKAIFGADAVEGR